VAVSFIGGGNRSTRPQVTDKLYNIMLHRTTAPDMGEIQTL